MRCSDIYRQTLNAKQSKHAWNKCTETNALNHANIVPALNAPCACITGTAGSQCRTRTGPHLLGTSCIAPAARTSGENCTCRPSQGALLLLVPPSGQDPWWMLPSGPGCTAPLAGPSSASLAFYLTPQCSPQTKLTFDRQVSRNIGTDRDHNDSKSWILIDLSCT